jgi:ATP/maltotriose-dependent transcriptional regulator MalT
MDAASVIGRDEELGSIEAFLSEVSRRPAALVLSGEAGIGKTVLWDAGLEEAERRACHVLRCRGVEAEALLSFAGLSELLAPVFDAAAPSLPTPRRRALEVALLLAEPGDDPPDAHAVGLAVLDVLRALAEHRTVVIGLDDVQWLDPSTAGVLQIAFRRLAGDPIGLLATMRTGPGTATPFGIDGSFPKERVDRLSLGPLGAGVLHRLLKRRLDLELTRPELTLVQDATAGTPFFALELGRELVRTNARPETGQTLRVPDSLQELLGDRLARLPGDILDVLLQVAALAQPTVDVVVAAHGDRERVIKALEAAVAEGVVELDDARVRFVHPLLASICYEQAPVWKRRAIHRALARAVTEREERARHLALAAEGPDAAIAVELDHAAEHAASRGATAAAAALCELAAELTPGDPAVARKRRMRAASFHRLAGDVDRAAATLERLLDEVPSGLERSDVLFALASTFRADPRTIVELCERALTDASGDDARLARILAWRSHVRLFVNDINGALVDARSALEKAERVDDPVLLAVAIARVGQAETWAAEATPGLLERGTEIEARLELSLEYVESPRFWLARLRTRLGEIEGPRSAFEDLEAKAAARGDEGTRIVALGALSMLEWLAGRWARALDLANVAHELAEQGQNPHTRVFVSRVKALVETDLGLVERARATAEEGLAISRANADDYFTIASLGALGRLELALGNLDVAGNYLRDLPSQLLAGGMHDPTSPVWVDSIEALIVLGELEQARSYLDLFALHAHRLGSPWGLAAAARCSGILGAADGDLGAAFAGFGRAVAELDAHPYPFERARTLLSLGSAHRQAKQKRLARAALEQALAIFEELGARLWAEKARSELKRISGRRRMSAEDLTETEDRVARLAAQGLSNKAIAAELFMSVHTVGAHLSRAYRKLAIRSRGELARRLDAADETANATNHAAIPASDAAKQ